MVTQESVTLISDIQTNPNCLGSAFTTKLAKPLNLPGQWRVSIMDISYPNIWTTIHRDLTYAVLLSMINAVPEYDHHSILHRKQPIGLGSSAVNTEKPEQMPQPQANLFDDFKEINFLDTGPAMKLLRRQFPRANIQIQSRLFNKL